MDVGVVSTSFPRERGDWAGRFVLDQAKALTARGHQVSVVAPDDPGVAEREEVEGVPVQRVRYFLPRSMERLCYGAGILENVRRRPWAALQLPLLVRALGAGVERLKPQPEVVLAHWALAGRAAAPFERRRGIGLATTLNGSDLRLALANRRWASVVRRALSGSDMTFVLGAQMADQVVGAGLAPASKVAVVPYGVDDELLEREVGGGEPGLVVFVGRLVGAKGVRELAQAVTRLATDSALGAGEVRLRCVGAGPLLEELSAMPHVTCTGPVGREALLDEMARASVVALPSRGEGLPITVLEAMALARPVVATPVGAVPELLRVRPGEVGVLPGPGERRAGVLVPVGDVDALAGALAALLSDEGVRATLGQRARERIREGYTWSAAASVLEDALAKTARMAAARL